MDIEKLIERLRTDSLCADKATLEIMDLCLECGRRPLRTPGRKREAAGGCYCWECKYKDECIRRIEFIGRNFVLEQNTYEYHPLSFCFYGQRKETDLDEAIEKYLKIKEGGQHGQAENLRGAWG